MRKKQELNEKFAMYWMLDDVESVRILVEHPLINVNTIDPMGRNVLMWASEKGLIEIMQIALDRKVKINQQDFSGKSALMYAGGRGKEEAIRLLIKNGADEDLIDKNGRTYMDFLLNMTSGKEELKMSKAMPSKRNHLENFRLKAKRSFFSFDTIRHQLTISENFHFVFIS